VNFQKQARKFCSTHPLSHESPNLHLRTTNNPTTSGQRRSSGDVATSAGDGKNILIPRYEHTQPSKAEEGEMVDQVIHLASKKASNLA
jgi:hypothetical protein